MSKTYKATAYLRLSYTGDHSAESDSVANQRRLIADFVAQRPEIQLVKTCPVWEATPLTQDIIC